MNHPGTRHTARPAPRGLSLCVVLLASLAGPSPASAVDLSMPAVEAAPGETVRIPLVLEGLANDEILSLNIDIRFDISLLPAASVGADRRGSLTSAWSLATNARQLPGGSASEGQLLMAGATASSVLTRDGTLLFIDIFVPESAVVGASTPLAFFSVLFNNGDPTATTTDGSLTVVAPRIKADFSGHPLEGSAPLEVRFEHLSSEGVTTWLWDFGDGESSDKPSPRHLFTDAGDYTVSLTVTTGTGTGTETKPDYIKVSPDQQPPAIVEGPVARGITYNKAYVFWKTNEVGDSEVVYCGLNFRPDVGNVDELMEGLAAEIGEEDVAARLKLGQLSFFDRIDCGRVVKDRLERKHNVRLTGLLTATVYVYRVRSTDAAGNPSRWRGGIFVTRGRPDVVPPKITWGPRVTSSPTRAEIRWKTDEPSNSFVSISEDKGFDGDERITDDELVTDHRVWVDVQPGRKYYVRVRSTDDSGNSSPLKRTYFRTPRVDNGVPVLLGDPLVTRRTASEAVIFVEANEPVTLRVEYGLTEDYGASVTVDELAREQRALLSHLQQRTVYHFRVLIVDATGNETVSGDFSFVTTEDEDDDAPDFVLEPFLLKALHDHVLISWEANEDVTAAIEFGLDERFGNVVEVAEALPSHTQALTGLSPGTTYFFRVLITDLAGNGPVTSAVFHFRTAKQIDTVAPILVGPVRISRRTDTRITVNWKTDEASTSHVDFGADAQDLDHQASDDKLTTRHSVTLTHLEPATTIFLQVTSSDAEGNSVTSQISSATTKRGKSKKSVRILSGPDIVARTATTVVVEWLTDRKATSAVEYGTTVNFDSESVTSHRTRKHRVVLTGLTPATTYFLQATSGDGKEASEVSSRVLAVTTRAEADTRPPRLRHISLAQRTSTAALITWQTDEPAGGWVEIGSAAHDYDHVFGDPSLERRQQVLITGLMPKTKYHYRLRAVDASGNESFSKDRSLKTGSKPDKKKPRYVEGPVVVTSHATATFVWRTDESSFGTVVVATEGNLGSADEEFFAEERAGVKHRITVTGLTPGVRYVFVILSTDLSGNIAIIGERRPGAKKVLRPDEDGGVTSFTTATEIDQWPPVFTAAPRELSRSDSEVLIGWETDEVSDTRLFLVDDTGAETLVEFVPEHDFTHQALLGGLTPGTTYTVIAASTDPSGNGPARSAALTFTTPVRADAEPPAFTARPVVVANSDDAATISWSTDEAARGVVRYGVSDLESRLAMSEPAIDQRAQLSDLQPGTTYRYVVDITDGSGNTATSEPERSFTTTTAADDRPPALTRTPAILALRPTGATVDWTTDEGADGFVNFGTEVDQLDQTLGSAAISRSHAVELTNLLPSTTYFFQVSSVDAWGNGPTTSSHASFTTPATVDPQASPTGLRATVGAHGVVHLRWDAADGVGWRVYRATGSGPFVAIAGPLSQADYVDRGVAADGDIGYRLTAIGADGAESDATVEVTLRVSLTAGDFDGDGAVDFDDFFILIDLLGLQRTDARFDARADFDGDGMMTLDDLFAFVDLFATDYSSSRPLATRSDRPADVRLDVSGSTPGQWTVVVTAPPSRAWGIRLNYDAARLVPRVDDEPNDTRGLFVVDDRPGTLTLAGFGDPRDGVLARVSFTALPGAAPGWVRLAAATGIDASRRPWQAASAHEVLLRPESVELLGNVPNPFNPSTQIRFQLPRESLLWLTIYDAIGQPVARLVDGEAWPAGLHALAWDGRDSRDHPAASGLYFLLLQTPDTRRTGKLLLLR